MKKKGENSEEAIEKILKEIKGYSEDVFGFVWDKIQGTEYRKLKLPHAVVQQEKSSLEREFTSRKVRRVHYRKQPVKVLKAYPSGMVKQVAYCCDKDFPVECYKIPKEFQ